MSDLAYRLSLPRHAAVGLMEMLWHFTARYTPQGDIGKYSDAAIAEELDWRASPEMLIRSLMLSGWLEEHSAYRLIVHDWPDHSDQTVSRYLKNHGLEFIQSETSTELASNYDETRQPLPLPVPKPVPVPEPLPAEPPPFPEAVDPEDPMYAGPFKPPAHHADIAKADQHILGIFGRWRAEDTNAPTMPDRRAWVEKMIDAAGRGPEGVAYVMSFKWQDLRDAFSAFLKRSSAERKKYPRFTWNWVSIGREIKREKHIQTAHEKTLRQEATQAQGNELAKKLAADKVMHDEEQERDKWWGGIDVKHKKMLFDDYRKQLGFKSAPESIVKRWAYKNRRRQDDDTEG